MKYGSFKAVCLIIWACIAVLSAYGDDVAVDLESIVLETFNGDTSHEWQVGNKTMKFEYSWALEASRFTTKTDDASFPQQAYVEAWPVTVFGYNREGRDLKSLGIHGRFDRRGYNWIDVYPVAADGETPFEIPMPGRVRNIDMWVWGSNLNYYMEVYVRDYQGMVHLLPLGNISYTGWRNLRVNVPGHIPQAKRILPSLAALHFVKFRIWTQPTERVNDFYIYLKQFKVLTDTFESLFDGDDLADPERVAEIWADGNQ
ncbi:MAG: flagellar filament outer layer protein FlaA [Treponema sp.]|jgi:hypothetical protein|nr:flagellar filament outer layer protein FlaA [Treponema sp.]